jgi:excisionase family DNA binding protein
MGFEELATKKDLLELERRIIQALSKNNIDNNHPLDIDEAAKYIHAKRSTLYKLTSNKEIAFSKVGKRIVFKICDLDKFLATHRSSSNDEIREKVNSRRY